MNEFIKPEDYDAFCETQLKRNEKFLETFAEDIHDLSPKVQRVHIGNVESFLNDYLVQRAAVPMQRGARLASDYFGYFLPRKGMCSGEEIRSAAASVKKFYKSMVKHGLVEEKEYKYLCTQIGEGIEEWIQERVYADPQ